MKLLSFIFLLVVPYSSYAVEFHSCTDANGQTHFTNLPKTSLDSNCSHKDPYSLMFHQDYANLSNEFAKYEQNSFEGLEEDVKTNSFDNKAENFELSEITPDTVKNKVMDIFDPDKALEELMTTTENRDDAFTRAIRGRAKGIEGIIQQKKP